VRGLVVHQDARYYTGKRPSEALIAEAADYARKNA